jgi:hypothetical protein
LNGQQQQQQTFLLLLLLLLLLFSQGDPFFNDDGHPVPNGWNVVHNHDDDQRGWLVLLVIRSRLATNICNHFGVPSSSCNQYHHDHFCGTAISHKYHKVKTQTIYILCLSAA